MVLSVTSAVLSVVPIVLSFGSTSLSVTWLFIRQFDGSIRHFGCSFRRSDSSFRRFDKSIRHLVVLPPVRWFYPSLWLFFPSV
ncbi:hypothetical protein [Lysinibacillus sp. G4S2]|uniref:hypothetical protein n=1 Tax=Lysinibacillus sp. G4S2 TaxID=3055859 RepID=UPI0025A1B0D3|nr:hypothetical protein [Lysinibacillus sp. G4S2]MDM5248254.1 hypothetical protein [Lysinibacillus sp. G4S2]